MRTLFHWGPRSLSARVFWVTVIIVFVVDMVVMMPGLGREWQRCLTDRLTRAELAVVLLPGQGPAGLLARSGTISIAVTGAQVIAQPGLLPVRIDAVIDMDHATSPSNTRHADHALLGLGAPYLQLSATFPLRPDTRIAIIISRLPVTADLRIYFLQMAGFSIMAALITGALVYAVLNQLLVKPMQIMTANIVAFRRDPEYARLSGLKWLSTRCEDEISRAARELVTMQGDLRTALWRNAQLAALGTAVAKVSHDLRNILASAVMVAERFQIHRDPVVRQSSETLIASMTRAVELMSRAMESTGGEPPPVARSPVPLRDLANEAAEFLQQGGSGTEIDNLIPGSLVLPLDRNQIYRAVGNLLRNAAEAGASRVQLSIEDQDGVTCLVVADNGPGLNRKAVAGLFRPFTGSDKNRGMGLGLSIARELVRAHGGDLLLRKTSSMGTEFVMSLPAKEPENN